MDTSPNDTLRPQEVRDILSDQEARMLRLRPEMEEHKATYLTRYWANALQGMYRQNAAQAQTQEQQSVEVNRLWAGVETHVSQLYPHTRRVVLSPDESGRGDPAIAQACLNAWWRKPGVSGRILAHLRQAQLWPGSGFTMEVRPGRGSPVQRTDFTLTPYWQMILDSDVFDATHQRFRGRRYWLPLRQAVAAWPQLVEKGVKGRLRDEFLRPFQSGSTEGQASSAPGTHVNGSNVVSSEFAKTAGSGDAGTGSEWLEVVEFLNLVDGYSEGGADHQGRFEVYIMGQSGEMEKEPLIRSRAPFADSDGVPLPHVVPTLLAFEPDYPLRGIAPVRRFMPQQRELNTIRTEVQRRIRQSVDKILVKAGVNSDVKQQLALGINLEIISVETDEDIRAVVYQMQALPIGQDFKTYADLVERDLGVVMALSANRQGQQNKGATAYEVQSINLYDDAETRKHATTFESTCVEVSKLALAGMILAAQTPADHRSGYAVMRGDQKVTATAVVSGDESGMGDVAAAAASEATGEASVGVDPALLGLVGGPPPEGTPTVAVVGEGGVTVESAQQSWVILDPETGRTTQVAVDALDGNFVITSVDGAETPLTAQAQQQNLIAIQDKYMGLWDIVQKGGPMAVLARRYMVALHDKLKLPKDLHPDRLQEAVDEEAKKGGEVGTKPSVAARNMAPPPEAVGDSTQKLLVALATLAEEATAAGAADVADALATTAEAVKQNDIMGAATAMDQAYSLANMGGHVDLEGRLGPIKELMEQAAEAMMAEQPAIEEENATV
jgi:hypothetical protein